MKIGLLLTILTCLTGLSACMTAPITNDYGEYPSHYDEIARQFYQGKKDIKPIRYVFAYQPKQYTQNHNDYGFSVPYEPEIWLNNSMRKGLSVKGYLICVIETNFHNGYKVDALLVHNGKVISVIYNVRNANINGMEYKLCEQEDKKLLGMLEKINRENNLQYIDNFIEELKRKH